MRRRGYTVEVAIQKSIRSGGRWLSLGHDYFQAFDIMATKENGPVRWVQVTTRENASHRKVKVNKVPLSLSHNSVEVWGWDKRGFFQIYKKTPEGWLTYASERLKI